MVRLCRALQTVIHGQFDVDSSIAMASNRDDENQVNVEERSSIAGLRDVVPSAQCKTERAKGAAAFGEARVCRRRVVKDEKRYLCREFLVGA